LNLRGHVQSLHVYGVRGGPPVVLSSGDGGWIHLAPHVAGVLAAHGYFVVGFDARAYLSSFTDGRSGLRPNEVGADYLALTRFAAQGSHARPILIGVSEGAGLSVLAACDPAAKSAMAGVLGLGLPDINELAWRWKDAVIYVTHRVPNEPTFRASSIVNCMTPVPLAAIHSTGDEFVALADVQRVLDAAREPKKLWVVNASDHRFTSNLAEFDRRLLEALSWIGDRARDLPDRASGAAQ
jgi:fermentation-respiration switch protein FrsA (DUF1100 family)